MSKLSFRARALDATKSMPIFRKYEVSDLPDYSVLNRAVPQMPTGMEKEEESEHHLQRAISAQQVYGDKKVMVIPVPEAEVGVDYYNSIYRKSFRVPKQYIHNQAQALNSIMEQEKPDYDMDSEDERWVKDTNKRTGLEITDVQFEEMIDRLEKSCGNQAVTLQEAKLLLKEDDDLIKAVYEYWLQKRKISGSLSFQVRQEKRDGSSSGDSYVAFRRRTEKMQTRKNRKNDEASYEKMLKLRRDLSRAVTILEMIKRREKGKRELLHLTLEIAEKRYHMKDWDGKCLKFARREAVLGSAGAKSSIRNKHFSGNRSSGIHQALLAKQKGAKLALSRENGISHKKRYKKHGHGRLHLPSSTSGSSLGGSSLLHPAAPTKRSITLPTSISNSKLSSTTVTKTSVNKSSGSYPRHIPSMGVHGATPKSPGSGTTFTYQEVVKTMHQYEFPSSDDETRPHSPLSGSVAPEDERKKNPDGVYALKRKPGCKYIAPRDDLSGDNWPWMTDDRHRYSLTTLTVPEKCMGFCRRRVGRGGRVMLDRAYTPWNRQLNEIDLNPEANHLPHKPDLQELLEEIKHGRWRRYRPYDPLTHKAHKLMRKDNQDEVLSMKSFGHASISSFNRNSNAFTELKGTKRQTESSQASSDSETVDIMTTDESVRGGLLHKRLLQRSPNKLLHSSSPQRNRLTPQKRILVRGGTSLDKNSAMFAVSALVSSASKSKSPHVATDSPHKSKVKSGRVNPPLKLNVVSANSPSLSSPDRSAPGAMTIVGKLPASPPGKYAASTMPHGDTRPSTPKQNKGKTVGKYTMDHAKFFGKKGQDKVHATLMSVASLHSNSSTANSVTFTVSGPTPKVTLTATCGSLSSAGVVSLTVAQPGGSSPNTNNLHLNMQDTAVNAAVPQRSTNMPVTVMATLRIANPVSGGSSNLQGAIFTNSNGDSHSTLGSSYTINNQTVPACDNQNTVIIAPTTRIHYTKAGGSDQNVVGAVPLTLSTVNSALVATQLKQNQQNLLVGHQPLGPNLNLALTPSTPQKHAALSQLSIPHSSGHGPAVLIATPASGSLASSLPSHCASGMDTGKATMVAGVGHGGSNQTKTVSINVARVQTSSSAVGQVFTLQQQHQDVNVGGVSAPNQAQSTQHSASWVTSGSGPNILKLGTSSIPTGIQIRPVNSGIKSEPGIFKMGPNKSLTVIPKRPRSQQQANATRTISIANAKQQGQMVNNKPSSHITLLPDGRNNLPKPLISIGHSQKNNASVLLAAKSVPVVDQDCLLTSDSGQISTQLNVQAESVVGDASGLANKTTKSNQPMEVT